MKLEFSQQIFEKYSNIKFHENPSSWSRILMKLELSQQIFEKYSNVKFHENPPSGNQTSIFSTDFRKILKCKIS